MTFLDNHDTEYRRELEHTYENYGTRHFPGKKVDHGLCVPADASRCAVCLLVALFRPGSGDRRQIDQLIRIRKRPAFMPAAGWTFMRPWGIVRRQH